MALKAVVSIYTCETNPVRKAELVAITSQTFPHLQVLVSKLMQNYNSTTEMLIFIILKIFGYATFL